MLRLVENEIFKVVCKKRMLIIFLILLVLIFAFAYGERNSLNRTKERLTQRMGIIATTDWHNLLEQQILDMKNRMEISSERRDAGFSRPAKRAARSTGRPGEVRRVEGLCQRLSVHGWRPNDQSTDRQPAQT